jgi:hypothetical protein
MANPTLPTLEASLTCTLDMLIHYEQRTKNDRAVLQDRGGGRSFRLSPVHWSFPYRLRWDFVQSRLSRPRCYLLGTGQELDCPWPRWLVVEYGLLQSLELKGTVHAHGPFRMQVGETRSCVPVCTQAWYWVRTRPPLTSSSGVRFFLLSRVNHKGRAFGLRALQNNFRRCLFPHSIPAQCDATQFFLLFGFFCHLISIVVPFVPKVITLVPAVPHLVGFCTLLCSGESCPLISIRRAVPDSPAPLARSNGDVQVWVGRDVYVGFGRIRLILPSHVDNKSPLHASRRCQAVPSARLHPLTRLPR